MGLDSCLESCPAFLNCSSPFSLYLSPKPGTLLPIITCRPLPVFRLLGNSVMLRRFSTRKDRSGSPTLLCPISRACAAEMSASPLITFSLSCRRNGNRKWSWRWKRMETEIRLKRPARGSLFLLRGKMWGTERTAQCSEQSIYGFFPQGISFRDVKWELL